MSVCDFVFDHNLSQFIDQPTHTGNHTLDLVTNWPDYLVSHRVYTSEFLYSDYFLINISLDFKPHSNPSKHPVLYGYDYARGDFNGLVSYLLEGDFDSCQNSVDIESLWHSFKHNLLQASHKFIPKIKLRRHVYPKWFTKEICHQIKCIRTLRRKYKSRAQASTIKSLEHKISQLEADIAMAKEAYENDLMEQAS
uniref:Endonuclease/exonuclease/phosphatase domain-containing protein n=1 Tax=Amphimedon queenslandica TaxID=400682 RepID=A0A1X7V2M7_AMPQE